MGSAGVRAPPDINQGVVSVSHSRITLRGSLTTLSLPPLSLDSISVWILDWAGGLSFGEAL